MRRAITVKYKYKEQTTPRRRTRADNLAAAVHIVTSIIHILLQKVYPRQPSNDTNLLRHDLTGDDVLARLLDFL